MFLTGIITHFDHSNTYLCRTYVRILGNKSTIKRTAVTQYFELCKMLYSIATCCTFVGFYILFNDPGQRNLRMKIRKDCKFFQLFCFLWFCISVTKQLKSSHYVSFHLDKSKSYLKLINKQTTHSQHKLCKWTQTSKVPFFQSQDSSNNISSKLQLCICKLFSSQGLTYGHLTLV